MRRRSASTAPATDPGVRGAKRGVQATEGTAAFVGHGAVDGSRQRVYSGLCLPPPAETRPLQGLGNAAPWSWPRQWRVRGKEGL